MFQAYRWSKLGWKPWRKLISARIIPGRSSNWLPQLPFAFGVTKDKPCSHARVDHMPASAEHRKLYKYQWLGFVSGIVFGEGWSETCPWDMLGYDGKIFWEFLQFPRTCSGKFPTTARWKSFGIDWLESLWDSTLAADGGKIDALATCVWIALMPTCQTKGLQIAKSWKLARIGNGCMNMLLIAVLKSVKFMLQYQLCTSRNGTMTEYCSIGTSSCAEWHRAFQQRWF